MIKTVKEARAILDKALKEKYDGEVVKLVNVALVAIEKYASEGEDVCSVCVPDVQYVKDQLHDYFRTRGFETCGTADVDRKSYIVITW